MAIVKMIEIQNDLFTSYFQTTYSMNNNFTDVGFQITVQIFNYHPNFDE